MFSRRERRVIEGNEEKKFKLRPERRTIVMASDCGILGECNQMHLVRKGITA